MSPGIAIAQGMIEAGHTCKLMISAKDVDSRLIANYPNLPFVRVPGVGFGWAPAAFANFQFQQIRQLIFAFRFLRAEKPDAILGFGGFLTVGAVLAGSALRIPIVLHEANRMPGRAIRLLSGFATRIYLPDGVRLKGLPPKTIRHVGYPVRKDIRRIPREAARRKLGFQPGGKLLLVMGGSQGAAALNSWVSAQFGSLAEEGINILCVSGLNKGAGGEVEHVTRKGQVMKALFMPFCDDMSVVMSASDLVVSRAGAGSIAEFIRCRLPSILVPYPHASDDHQFANAQRLEQQGGTVVLPQKSIEGLLKEVLDLIFNDWMLTRMRHNLERLDRQSPLRVIVGDLTRIVREGKGAAQ